jgi:hypothetical protein
VVSEKHVNFDVGNYAAIGLALDFPVLIGVAFSMREKKQPPILP